MRNLQVLAILVGLLNCDAALAAARKVNPPQASLIRALPLTQDQCRKLGGAVQADSVCAKNLHCLTIDQDNQPHYVCINE